MQGSVVFAVVLKAARQFVDEKAPAAGADLRQQQPGLGLAGKRKNLLASEAFAGLSYLCLTF
jgi:hypothetical protein